MTHSFKLILALVTIFAMNAFLSCKNIYYVGQTTNNLKLYNSSDTTANAVYVIPKGSKVLTKKKSKKYHYIIYGANKGYAYRPVYINYHKYDSSVDGELYGYATKKKKSRSSSSSSGGTVNVKGYYRKNGTYVSPHTRSAPKRKS